MLRIYRRYQRITAFMGTHKENLSSGKKIGFLVCEDAEKWGFEEGCGKLLVDVFSSMASKPVDNFTYIPAVTGKLPSEDDLQKYSGFIISGSHYSANDNKDWIRNLEEFLRLCKKQCYLDHTAPKVVGICFGHQVINKAFGGVVAKNPSGKFVFRTEEIKLTEKLKEKPYMEDFPAKTTRPALINQSHGDSVVSPAPGSEVLATSESCDYEILEYCKGILGIQGHPELSTALMVDKILPALKSKNILSPKEEEESFNSFKDKPNGKEFIDLILSFIDSKVE